MLTIENISTTVYRLPLHGKLQWGKHSVLHDVQHVLVRVRLSDGAEGVAEAPPRPTIYGETVYSITSIIEQELKPRLLAQSADDLSAMYQIKNNHTAKGAIDMAVHDALAVSKGISLLEQLQVAGGKWQVASSKWQVASSKWQVASSKWQVASGKWQVASGKWQVASESSRITHHASRTTHHAIRVSYILGIGDDDTVLAEAQRVFDQGVRVLKVKVGRDWDADLRRIGALQEMFGGEMAIYADANECLDVDSAASQLTQLAEMGVLYCEEPLPVEMIQERAQLRAGNYLPLIADDSTFTVRDLRREMALDTFDILNIKTARTGYTESLQMLALAQEADKRVMIGSQASSAIGTARAGIFAALPGVDCPSELSFFLKLKEDIVGKRPSIVDGWMDVAQLVDVKIDEDLLREAKVSQ